MNILIFGASGATGHELVKQALVQGHTVFAFVRNPEKLKVTHANLNIIQGDVVNYQLVEQAVKGKDVVLSALGAPTPFKYNQPITDGVNNIVKAMQTNGTKRFIYLSFIGTGEGRNDAGFIIKHIAPKLLKAEIKGHRDRESMIRQSHLQWTIIHSPTLTNGKHTSKYRSGENISSKGFTVTISRADVADFMLSQLSDTRFINKAARVMY